MAHVTRNTRLNDWIAGKSNPLGKSASRFTEASWRRADLDGLPASAASTIIVATEGSRRAFVGAEKGYR